MSSGAGLHSEICFSANSLGQGWYPWLPWDMETLKLWREEGAELQRLACVVQGKELPARGVGSSATHGWSQASIPAWTCVQPPGSPVLVLQLPPRCYPESSELTRAHLVLPQCSRPLWPHLSLVLSPSGEWLSLVHLASSGYKVFPIETLAVSPGPSHFLFPASQHFFTAPSLLQTAPEGAALHPIPKAPHCRLSILPHLSTSTAYLPDV